MPDAELGADAPSAPSPADDEIDYGPYYYAHDFGIPYEYSNDHWTKFFGDIADRIVKELSPVSVLDAGCAIGLLVEALHSRGVDAWGVDISEFAVEKADPSIRDRCWQGSLTEPLPRRYDLITCIEVVEHIPGDGAATAIENLCAASDRVLFSSSATDFSEPTHVNLRPPEGWSALFASQGFIRNLDYDATYICPWAVLYERSPAARSVPDAVRTYDRSWWRQQQEIKALRERVLEMHKRFEESVGADAQGKPLLDINDRPFTAADHRRVQEELVRRDETALASRDLVIGLEAEIGHLRGLVELANARAARHEAAVARLASIYRSPVWKVLSLGIGPYRKLRQWLR